MKKAQKINQAGEMMNGKEPKKGGPQSEEVINDFSEKLHSDLRESGYEGKELEEAFVKEKAAFVSAVNEFKEEVHNRDTHRQ